MPKKKILIQVKNYKEFLPKGVVDGVIKAFKGKKADGYILQGGKGMTKGAKKSWNTFERGAKKTGGFAKYLTSEQVNKIFNNLVNRNKNTN